MTGVFWAWLLLVAASAATTAVPLFEVRGRLAVAALLLLALVKSRIILAVYLRLSQVPPVQRGFMAVLVLWASVALALLFAAPS